MSQDENHDMKDIRDHFVEGIVVGRDPDNAGHVLVVPREHMGQNDPKPVSVPCLGSNKDGAASHMGHSPGHNIKNGSVVYVSWLNQQRPTVMGVLPGKDDYNVASSLPQILSGILAEGGDPHNKSVFIEGAEKLQAKFTEIATSINEQTKRSSIASRTTFRENINSLPDGVRDVVKHVASNMKNPLRDYIKEASAGMKTNIPKSVGGVSTKEGSIKDPTAFIKKQLGKAGEMIPQAFSMIESLKSAVSSGGPIAAATSIGGLDKWQKALAGIAQSQSMQQNEDRDELDYLCELFKELFPDFECRIDDSETEFFRKWKREYLAALQDEAIS